MKARRQRNEKGQALILILLAVAGLVGLTALAVDGGHVFATQRQARNAADTAAFAGAVAQIDEDAGTNYLTLAMARAAGNNFSDDTNDPGPNPGQAIDVIVNWPPVADSSGTPAAYVGNTGYVQVIIAAQVPTFFAPVIGVSSLPIRVQAVAKAKPPTSAPLGGDNGIVALGDVCNAVRTHGGGTTNLVGGGVFSNSSFNGVPGNCYSFNAGGSGVLYTDGVTLVGCLDPTDISGSRIVMNPGFTFDPAGDCGSQPIPYPPPPPDLGFTCADLPVGTRTGTLAHPGRWSTALGNLGGSQVFPPNGVSEVEAGVYCITGHFDVGASDTLTSNGDGVTFILDGDLRWNAGAAIDLLPSGSGNIAGLLIYRPLNASNGLCDGGSLPGTNGCQTLEINGGASTQFSGTIYAPDSLCDINGTSSSFSPDTQAICYVVDIGGDSTWSLTYSGSNNWDFPYPAETELNR